MFRELNFVQIMYEFFNAFAKSLAELNVIRAQNIFIPLNTGATDVSIEYETFTSLKFVRDDISRIFHLNDWFCGKFP